MIAIILPACLLLKSSLKGLNYHPLESILASVNCEFINISGKLILYILIKPYGSLDMKEKVLFFVCFLGLAAEAAVSKGKHKVDSSTFHRNFSVLWGTEISVPHSTENFCEK